MTRIKSGGLGQGIFIFLICLYLSPSVTLAEIPGRTRHDIQLPHGTQLSWVATDLTQNGVAMAIQTFSSPLGVEEVMAFYTESWGVPDGDVPGYVRDRVSYWHLISRLADDHNLVLQIQPDSRGGSSGFLSSMSLRPARAATSEELPAPSGAQTVSTTRVVDKDRVSTTSLLISHGDRGSIVGFYRDRLERLGWILASDRPQHDHHMLQFNKKHAKCELVVSAAQDGSTVITLNRVSYDE